MDVGVVGFSLGFVGLGLVVAVLSETGAEGGSQGDGRSQALFVARCLRVAAELARSLDCSGHSDWMRCAVKWWTREKLVVTRYAGWLVDWVDVSLRERGQGIGVVDGQWGRMTMASNPSERRRRQRRRRGLSARPQKDERRRWRFALGVVRGTVRTVLCALRWPLARLAA